MRKEVIRTTNEGPATQEKQATNSENKPTARTCAVLTLKSDAGSQQNLMKLKKNLSNQYIVCVLCLNVVATY
jgi:hypothetical protein